MPQGDRHSQTGHADVEASQRDLQREDSASYQRRPPALAERQDSASNLQVARPLLCTTFKLLYCLRPPAGYCCSSCLTRDQHPGQRPF